MPVQSLHINEDNHNLNKCLDLISFSSLMRDNRVDSNSVIDNIDKERLDFDEYLFSGSIEEMKHDVQCDIDSVYDILDDLKCISHHYFNIDLFAATERRLKKTSHITIDFGKTKVDIGATCNIFMGTFGHLGLFELYIVFPCSNTNAHKNPHHLFYDYVLLPAMKACLHDSLSSRICFSYYSMQGKCRDHKGRSMVSTFRLPGNVLNNIMNYSRTLISAANLECFDSFIFVVNSKNLKYLTRSSSVFGSLQIFNTMYRPLSDKSSTSRLYIDIGFEFTPLKPGMSFYWRREYLEKLASALRCVNSTLRWDNYLHSYDIAGFFGVMSSSIQSQVGVYCVQAYTSDKEILSKPFNKQVMDFIFLF